MTARGTPNCVEPGCTAPAHTRERCDSCYRRRIRMGFYGYVDAAEARSHVRALRELGWTWEAIAEAAGTSSWVPHKVGIGHTRHLWPESARALLAVPLERRTNHHGIDSTGTRRRVQALAWLGWPTGEVARRAGIKPKTLASLIQPSRRISSDSAARVAAVYEALCMTPGPSRIAASKARQLGFAPPLAWEPHTIDDPRRKPNGVLKGAAA